MPWCLAYLAQSRQPRQTSQPRPVSPTSTKHHISTLGILDLKLTHSVIGLDAHTPTDSRLDTLHLLVLCAIVRPQPPPLTSTILAYLDQASYLHPSHVKPRRRGGKRECNEWAAASPCNTPRPRAFASCVNVSVRNRAAISLIAEPVPQPRVYVRIASCEFGFRLVFLAGVCVGASIGARATGFSVCVGLVWRSVRLYLPGTRLWDRQKPLITRFTDHTRRRPEPAAVGTTEGPPPPRTISASLASGEDHASRSLQRRRTLSAHQR